MSHIELKVSDVSDEQLCYYRLQARNHAGLTGRLFINDVEVHRFTPDKSQISCDNIQNWLMPGDNYLVISITEDGSIDLDDETPLYECALHGMTSPGIPDDTNCLWSISLEHSEKNFPMSRAWQFCFTSLQVPSSQLWRNAEVVDVLNDNDRNDIVALQNKLVLAFEDGKSDEVLKMYDFILTEEASMLHDSEQIKSSQVIEEMEFLSDMTQQGLVKFTQQDDVYFNHIVGNRVIQLCSDAGGATVTINGGEGEYIDLNIFASRIDKEWHLVRR
ncbi:hypothetical protein MNBD_GAMMA12-187 [hydrothermal vent metagenome]|uniref:Uncharacterized protein n=1 Tax=hydrothermal vent metagenome TaxID=652676 RepID=A0A3B0YZR9_9ZZZZ